MYEVFKNSFSNVISFVIIVLLCLFGWEHYNLRNDNSSTDNTLTRVTDNNLEAGKSIADVGSFIERTASDSIKASEAVAGSSKLNSDIASQLEKCSILTSEIIRNNLRAKQILAELVGSNPAGTEQMANKNN